MKHTIGLWTPRQNLVNGFVFAAECAAARGEMSWFNAERNIADLDRVFPTDAALRRLCERTGVEPLAELPRLEGPGFPPANRSILGAHDGNVQPNREWRQSADANCEHRWIVLQWSGYDCNECGKHFGAWD